jgi:hypothetical protein
MPFRNPRFKFGTFMVRVSSCELITLEPCVPPSCANYSICYPGYTMARVLFEPGISDPAELKKLLKQVQSLGLEAEVVVRESPDQPGEGVAALSKVLGT